MKAIPALLAIFVSLPIWFFLLHRILEAVNANELMWFLYWVYVPVSLLVSIIGKVLADKISD